MKAINKFLQETETIQIYLDMDGVICDWDGQFIKYAKMSANDYTEKYGEGGMWKLINNIGVKFWSDMPWMIDGKKLWDYVKQYNPIILSKPSRHPTCKIGKRIWIQKNLGKDVPYILEKDKSKYSDKGSLLIDDMVTNIYPWKQKGGLGILHKNSNDTLARLKNILRQVNFTREQK